jgi:hypothetical protein
MNNVVDKEVAPQFPEVERHNERVRFLNHMKTTERFLEVFLEGTSEEIRKKRKQLEDGRHLLDCPETLSRCDKLIRAFTARLATIPTERYLRMNLAK